MTHSSIFTTLPLRITNFNFGSASRFFFSSSTSFLRSILSPFVRSGPKNTYWNSSQTLSLLDLLRIWSTTLELDTDTWIGLVTETWVTFLSLAPDMGAHPQTYNTSLDQITVLHKQSYSTLTSVNSLVSTHRPLGPMEQWVGPPRHTHRGTCFQSRAQWTSILLLFTHFPRL